MTNPLAPTQAKMLLRFNFPAPPLSVEDIDCVLSNDDANTTKWLVEWLESFFKIPRNCMTREVLCRYSEINSSDYFLSIAPTTFSKKQKGRLDEMYNLLQSACLLYSLEEYKGSIFLTGSSMEQCAVMLWEMGTNKSKSCKKIEKMAQSDRIKKLKNNSCFINESHFQDLTYINSIRNNLIHVNDHESINEQKEAKKCYRMAMATLKASMQIELDAEKITHVNNRFLFWLNKPDDPSAQVEVKVEDQHGFSPL